VSWLGVLATDGELIPRTPAWPPLIFVAVGASVIAFLLATNGQKRVGPTAVAVSLTTAPLFAVLGVVAIAGETIGALRLTGIVAGVGAGAIAVGLGSDRETVGAVAVAPGR
jgi:drug/metabolite transporter (DMT)-like permease